LQQSEDSRSVEHVIPESLENRIISSFLYFHNLPFAFYDMDGGEKRLYNRYLIV